MTGYCSKDVGREGGREGGRDVPLVAVEGLSTARMRDETSHKWTSAVSAHVATMEDC